MRSWMAVLVGGLLTVSAGGVAEAAKSSSKGPVKVQWGGLLGVNVATFGGSDASDGIYEYESRTGVCIGGFAEITQGVEQPFFVRPGLLISTKGAKYSYSMFWFSAESETQLTYLDVPVMAGYRFPGKGPVRIHVMAGPVLSLLMSAEVESTVGGVTDSMDIKDEMSPVDVGLAIGGGVTFPVSPTLKLTAELKYTLGAIKTFSPETGTVPSIYNRAFTLQAGALF